MRAARRTVAGPKKFRTERASTASPSLEGGSHLRKAQVREAQRILGPFGETPICDAGTEVG